MILLWGLPSDGPLHAVRDALHREGAPFLFLDQSRVLDADVAVRIDHAVGGLLRTPDWVVDLGALTAVYLRLDGIQDILAARPDRVGVAELEHAARFEDILVTWCELTPALVVNRLSAMASNGSKPYQAGLIAAHGFAVPDTLVTTDTEAVLTFAERHQAVIYKSLSGTRSIVARLTPAHFERLADIAWCPTQFQEFVPGTDHRVHVIGDDVFASEIVCAADDYRYASRQGLNVSVRRCEISADVAQRSRSLAESFGLVVAGIDLRRTPDGCWYCFEVNPSPGFTYYQDHTGQPIADAVASVLRRRASVLSPLAAEVG